MQAAAGAGRRFSCADRLNYRNWPVMPHLSKSSFMAGLQYKRRLWLGWHDPIPVESVNHGLTVGAGINIGRKARQLFPGGRLVTGDGSTFTSSVVETMRLMADPSVPAIFEAAFECDGVRIRGDIMERLAAYTWGLREVKLSTELKDEHYDDIAIQLYVLSGTGIKVRSIELIYVNKNYIRGTDIDWRKFFARANVRTDAEAKLPALNKLVAGQQAILRRPGAPNVQPAHHCHTPVPCEFWDRCTARKPNDWIFYLPRLAQKRFDELHKAGITSIRRIPKSFALTLRQDIIRNVLKSGREYISTDLAAALKGFEPPAFYLDFETMNPVVPLYPGTSPYQRIPFQWSLHHIGSEGKLTHNEFLADEATDPRPKFVASLLSALKGSNFPIIVYSGFEKSVLVDMAAQFPRQRMTIRKLQGRLRDLLQVARGHMYHPDFQFSHSIKSVGPALAPSIRYDDLGEIADGGAASRAFERLAGGQLEDNENPVRLRHALLNYCARDTLAMVEVHRAMRTRASRR